MSLVRWGGGGYRTIVLAAVFGLAAFLGWAGPLAYAALIGAAGLLLAPLALRGRPRPWPEALALAALAAWAAVTLAWSPALRELAADSYADLEANTALKLGLQLVVYGLFVAAAAGASTAVARRTLGVFAWSAAVWCAVLAFDGVSGGRLWAATADLLGQPVTLQFQEKKAAQGAYVLAVLVWPAVGWFLERRPPGAKLLLPLAVLVGSIGLSAYAATVAAVAGALAYGLVRQGGRTAARLLGAAAALALLLTPVLVLEAERLGAFDVVRASLTQSWAARADIWAFAAGQAAARPFLGWGLDASRHFGDAVPLHPHNGPLQLWLELGVVGVLIAAVFWLLLSRRISRLAQDGSPAGAIAAATAAAYFTVGALSFGVWQEWWLAAGALAAALCALYAKVRAEEEADMERFGLERA